MLEVLLLNAFLSVLPEINIKIRSHSSMSLLTQISKLFSKQQTSQIIGIALQQESLNVCAVKEEINISADQGEVDKLSFYTQQVYLSDYAKTLTLLNQDAALSGQCHIVLNSQQYQTVQIDKPNVPDEEILAALKWQVKDLVTIPPENMVLDYFDGLILADGKEKIHVVCSPLNELKKIVSVMNQTDNEVISITTEEFAFANLLPVQPEAYLLACQQPNEEITLLIVQNGRLCFHRRLRGFSQIAKKSEDELAITMIDALALEIQRSSDYFERQLRQAPIKGIKLLLPMETESFFARKLAENTHFAVELLTLPEGYENNRSYAAAIGVTLPSISQLEKQLQKKEVEHVS